MSFPSTIYLLCAFWIVCLATTPPVDGTQPKKAKSCMLYPVNSTQESPSYDLRDEYDNFVTINNIFNKPLCAHVVNEENECVVALQQGDCDENNATCRCDDDSATCRDTFSTDQEYTTLVFRIDRGKTIIYKRDVMNHMTFLNLTSKELKVKTLEHEIGVAFDCGGNCYQFEKAVVHKHYTEGTDNSPFRIYGKIISPEEADTSEICFKNGKDWTITKPCYDRTFWIVNSTPAHQWFTIDFKAFFGQEEEDETYNEFAMNVTMTKSNNDSSSHTLYSRDLYLDFGQTSGIKWAAFCQPFDEPSTAPQGVVIEWLYLFILAGSTLFFIILSFVLGVCICCHRRLSHSEPSLVTDTHETDALRSRNSVESNDGSAGGQVHDYIDLDAFQQQLENERKSSSAGLEAATSDTLEEAAGQRSSYNSINSLYGCIVQNDC